MIFWCELKTYEYFVCHWMYIHLYTAYEVFTRERYQTCVCIWWDACTAGHEAESSQRSEVSAGQSLTRGSVESREEQFPTPRRRAFNWSYTNTEALRKERVTKHLHRPNASRKPIPGHIKLDTEMHIIIMFSCRRKTHIYL